MGHHWLNAYIMNLRRITNYLDRRAKRAQLLAKVKAAQAYTMCDVQAQNSLIKVAETIKAKQIPGDVVECGVCNGGTAAIMGAVLTETDRKMWLYDSFQGMPATDKVDGEDAKQWIGKCKASAATVREALAKVSFPQDRAHIHEGWFQDTFKEPLPAKIAILHIDADWYASVQICLETFYDRVSDGGYIVLDDFGYWEGCREAFYDFCKKRDIKPLLERAGRQQAYWVKGKTHNRTGA